MGMNKKIEKILSILDLSEDDQKDILWSYIDGEMTVWFWDEDRSYAELAFKLRDEAVADSKSKVDIPKGTWIWKDHPLDRSRANLKWDWAQRIVYDYIHNLPENRPTFDKSYSQVKYYEDYKEYWADRASPIHWILAALIMKELH